MTSPTTIKCIHLLCTYIYSRFPSLPLVEIKIYILAKNVGTHPSKTFKHPSHGFVLVGFVLARDYEGLSKDISVHNIGISREVAQKFSLFRHVWDLEMIVLERHNNNNTMLGEVISSV